MKRYGTSPAAAYSGAVKAIHDDQYDDQPAQFAHSLYETIEMLARLVLNDAKRKLPLSSPQIEDLIRRLVDPAATTKHGSDPHCKLLAEMHLLLSEVATHQKMITASEGLEILNRVTRALASILRPQIDINEEIDRMMRFPPSLEDAESLGLLMAKQSTQHYLVANLPPSWLRYLIDAGVFAAPPPDGKAGWGAAGARWPMSGYLVKCAQDFPQEVAKVIMSCPAGDAVADPGRCLDFTRCMANLPPAWLEKIASKAIDEGWGRLIANPIFIDPFILAVEALFRHKNYRLGMQFAYSGLEPVQGWEEAASGARRLPPAAPLDHYWLARAAADLAGRARRYSPAATARMLAHLLDAYLPQEDGVTSLPGYVVGSIEESDQNIGGVTYALVAPIRDLLEHVGQGSPGRLGGMLDIFRAKSHPIYRRLLLHTYRRFPDLFPNEIVLALHTYSGDRAVHHEYYHLFRERFGSLSPEHRATLYARIDRACGPAIVPAGSDTREKRMLRRQKLVLLDAVRDHLDGLHDAERLRLSEEFTVGDHPDYLSRTITRFGARPPELRPHPGGKSADDAARQAPGGRDPAAMPSGRGDLTADRLESDMAENPEDLVRRSDEVKDAGRDVQCAFIDGLNKAVHKNRIDSLPDVGGLLLHIISSELNGADLPLGHGRYDAIQSACYLLDTAFQNNVAIEIPEDRLWEILAGLLEIGAARADLECPKTPLDSGLEALDGVNGLSLVLVFRYAMWRPPGSEGGKSLSRLRSAVDEYLDADPPEHTLCRHAAIGLFAPFIMRADRDWAGDILGRLGARADLDKAFWFSYVSFNNLHADMFSMMWKWYDKFLNEHAPEDVRLHAIVDSTFQHVALAYFYDLEHADEIFDKYIKTAHPNALERTIIPIATIMEGKGDDHKFNKDKLAMLWAQDRIKPLSLGMWFRHSPLEPEITIGLYLDHLRAYAGTFDLSNAPVEELEQYVDAFPESTAECIIYIIRRADFIDYPAVKKIYCRLHGLGRADAACKNLRNELLVRGYDPDASDEE